MAVAHTHLKVDRKTAFRGFWVGLLVIGSLAFLSARDPNIGGVLGGSLVVLTALYPAYVWVQRRNGAIPVFPLYVSVMAVTHGLPLLVAPDAVMQFTSEDQFRAGLTVAACIAASTFVWLLVRDIKRRPVTAFREIPPRVGDKFFLMMLALSAMLSVAMTAGWIVDNKEGLFSPIRAAIFACGALACLIFGYRHGKRLLGQLYLISYPLLIGTNAVAFSASLLLNAAISYVLLAFVGFALGRQKIPWIPVVSVALVFSVLHAGKGEMREHYWYGTESSNITPREYPSIYSEWATAAWSNFTSLGDQADSASLLNRAGLIYLLLRVQDMTPAQLPYLGGDSYAHIPGLLVPRLLYPDKPSVHDGTILLNVHFGLQTLESSSTTTIGWGILNEAFANFGYVGAVLVFSVIGGALGWVERWSAGLPLLSFRALFTILLLSALITADATLAVFIATFAQGTFVLLAAGVVLMSTRRLSGSAEFAIAGEGLIPGSR